MTDGIQGFHDAQYEPVVGPLYGLRFWFVDEAVPPKEKGEVRAGPYLEPMPKPVTTHRHFAPKLAGAGGLRSLFKTEYCWNGGTNTASCFTSFAAMRAARLPRNHQVPTQKCGCGFWAYTDPNPEPSESKMHRGVYGIIEGWGHIVVGPKGFRCEKARIVALAFPPHRREVPPLIERVKGKPVVEHPPRCFEDIPAETQEAIRRRYPQAAVFTEIDDMLEVWPLSDLAGLLPRDEPEAS